MATGSFNISMGRESEFHWRVDNSDPTNSVLTLVALAAPVEDDTTLRQYDDLATLIAANPEVTNTGYARIELDNTDLTAFVVDDSANTLTLPMANQTTAAIDPGDSWDKLVIGYDPDSTGGTDSAIIPVKFYDIRDPSTNQAWVPATNTITFSFPDGYHVAL